MSTANAPLTPQQTASNEGHTNRRYDFFKHVTTLNASAMAFTAVLHHYHINRFPGAITFALLCFTLSLGGAFFLMFSAINAQWWLICGPNTRMGWFMDRCAIVSVFVFAAGFALLLLTTMASPVMPH